MKKNKYKVVRCSELYEDGCKLWLVVDANGERQSVHLETKKLAIEECRRIEKDGPDDLQDAKPIEENL
jgi:hypothetical protein